MNQPYVIIFLGSIGSGKSYFARHLADELNIIRINADAIRLSMYGSVEAIKAQDGYSVQANRKLFGAMNYFLRESLHRGQSVIYDTARFNGLKARHALQEIVEPYNARTILVWMRTDPAIAAERAQSRVAQDDQLKMSPEDVDRTLKFHNSHFFPPEPQELSVKIDGTAPFEQQLAAFRAQLHELGIELG